MTENYVKNKLSIITQKVSDALLKQERPEEPITLYILYYNTANWQNTNQPKCTTHFAAKKLHWGIRKVRRAKKVLVNLGLVEDVRAVHPKTKKVTGYYIKMNYKFKAKSESKVNELMELNTEFTCLKTSSAVKPLAATDTTNALSNNNLNALSKVSIVSKKERKMKNDVENSIYYTKNEKKKKAKNKPNNKRESYNSIIARYAKGNIELIDNLKKFIQIQYANSRKVLTNSSFERMLQKLDDMSGGLDYYKVAILDKSIEKGWRGIYELTDEERTKAHNEHLIDLKLGRRGTWSEHKQYDVMDIDEKLELWHLAAEELLHREPQERFSLCGG